MITIKVTKGVVEWILSAPPCNEIGLTMLVELEKALDKLEQQKPTALIIRSDLKSGFCAGADLKSLYEGLISQSASQAMPTIRSFVERIHSVFNRIDALSFPTIAVIKGVCFGGGLELALTCDILIAEENLRIAFPELRLGLIPGFGGIPRLKRDIGNAAIRDLLFTGRSFNAQKAQQLGLVSQVVAQDKGEVVAFNMAVHMSKYNTHVMTQAKRFIKTVPMEELELEKNIFLDLIQSPIVIEALKTFYTSENLRPYLA